MKKRRTLVISLLLIAALALGIGYAALSDDLFIDATVNFDPTVADDELAEDVKFTNATNNDYCYAGVSGNDPDGDTAFLHIGGETVTYELTTPGQSAVATYTIENNYEAAVAVTVKVEGAHDLYNVVTNVEGASNIESGKTGEVTVTVTPKEVLTEAITAESFRIELIATVIE